MILSRCNTRHQCANGREGECNQIQGHMGKHICRSCLSFFTGAEAGISGQPPTGSGVRHALDLPGGGAGANQRSLERTRPLGTWRPGNLRAIRGQDRRALEQQIAQLEQQIATTKARAESMHAQGSALMSNPYTAAAGAATDAQAAALDAQVSAMEAQLSEHPQPVGFVPTGRRWATGRQDPRRV